jgi:hypothetical protein
MSITETELKSIHTQFKMDFEEITKEYRQLAISGTDEIRRAEISKAKKEMKNPR